MEKEMEDIRNSKRALSPAPSTPSLTDDSEGSVIHDFYVPLPSQPTKQGPSQQLIAISKDGTCAILRSDKDLKKQKSDAEPWTLSVTRGQFSIDTQIKSYSDMLNNLYQMLQAVQYGMCIPPEFNDFIVRDALVHELNVLIRKKYGKVHCRNVAKSVRIFVTPDMSKVSTMTIAKSPENIKVTTDRLIRAYLQCQHYQQLAIHVPTFVRLFLGNEGSAATMSFCAMICTLRCQHIAACLPSVSLVEYGKFYFERARDRMADDGFDRLDLDSLTAYVFMAIYKFTVSEARAGAIYMDMADRISVVLAPSYRGREEGEAVHFSRLLNHLRRVLTFEEISRAASQADNATGDTRLPYCVLTHPEEGEWKLSKEDTEQEKQFAQMHTLILCLQRNEREASRNVYSPNLFRLIDLIGHQVEMSMKHWYFKVLPAHFRLSLPLFDSNVSCKVFNLTLERECAQSPIPILTTLAVYEEWIVLGQSFLPKGMPEPENHWDQMKAIWNGGRLPKDSPLSPKWKKRIQKLIALRDRIDFDGTDAEYLDTLENLWSAADSHMNRHIVITAVDSALITLRLIKYLRSRTTDCFFNMRVLVNAWQLLLVVSKLQITMPPEIQQRMPRIRKNLTTCLSIVYDELKLQPYQGRISDFVHTMEKELHSQILEEECECVACPNA
ncbi:hypothetical protein BY458DRAFT_526639 [Sporodiniella umbellata]|nr:hypothetical protein BY458DRAFT_526639 [Sporodiniella umbellata]